MTEGNVRRLVIDDKEVILIGTAHVSKKSAEEVAEVIEQEKPDSVCVELCESRYKTIMDEDKWKNTDIFSIIKQHKAMLLLVNLILSSYQKRLARQFGIQPGQEMIQGIKSAEQLGAELCLADRDIQTTMLRIWRSVSLWGKIKLLYQVLLSLLIDEEITEEEMEKMKSQDMLSATLDELASSFPQFKAVLVDERDRYLAQKIKEAPGKKVVAVLGAAHVPGVSQQIEAEHDLKELSQVPPTSPAMKIVGWSIPILILALIVSTFSVDRQAGLDQIISWILWTGLSSAVATALSMAHPLSVLVAFLVSPLSTLNPVLASGWFAGLMEAYIRKPSVRDFESISDDINTFKGFWRNKVTHVLLVVVFANLGSSFGAVVGGAEVIRHFLNTFM
ncbi:MAG: TraB/GumN family protein [Peptococcaceae bacterium]|nr:TraB/GumN family protein [Peptococcaceae bacterium]